MRHRGKNQLTDLRYTCRFYLPSKKNRKRMERRSFFRRKIISERFIYIYICLLMSQNKEVRVAFDLWYIKWRSKWWNKLRTKNKKVKIHTYRRLAPQNQNICWWIFTLYNEHTHKTVSHVTNTMLRCTERCSWNEDNSRHAKPTFAITTSYQTFVYIDLSRRKYTNLHIVHSC